MATSWPPGPRDQEQPYAVTVGPAPAAYVQQPFQGQPPQQQQTWGMPAPPPPGPVSEETKDYGRGGPVDRPGPYLSDPAHPWKGGPGRRRTFKSEELGAATDDNGGTKYHDLWAAGLFLAHVAVILWLAFTGGLKVLRADATNNNNESVNIEDDSIVKLSVGGAVCTLVAAIISFLALRVMINHSRVIIQFMILGGVVLQGIAAVAAFFAGQMWLFIMSLVFAAISLCYYKMVQDRIPFAATNLTVACAAIKRSSGPMAAALLMTFVQMIWQAVWIMAMLGAVVSQGGYSIEYQGFTFASDECTQKSYPNQAAGGGGATYQCICQHAGQKKVTIPGQCPTEQPAGGVIFLMLLSFFWGSMVIQNVLHCTVAGVVAEWFLNGTQTASSTWSSMKRATTTSFGSICFGSLLVAIIRTVHQVLLEARKSNNNTMVACAECLLSLVERAAEYFTKYAFVEVSLYGKSFIESGKAAMNLFRSRGLTAVINDQLVSTVFTFGSLTSSVLVALFGYLYGVGMGINRDYVMLMAGLGFMIGLVVSSIVMNVLDSAVATVFVCWAEMSDALDRTHHDLYVEMSDAWAKFQLASSSQV